VIFVPFVVKNQLEARRKCQEEKAIDHEGHEDHEENRELSKQGSARLIKWQCG
jgi:hypothetical protein